MPKSSAKKQEGPSTILNRKARHNYEILSTYEAGIALVGAEVKSVLQGKVNLVGSFCRIEEGELWLHGMDIAPYPQASSFQPERARKRKLLMHRRELELLQRRADERGLTIIPLAVYFKNRRVKVEIAVARGKKLYDKREKIEKKDLRRGRA